MPNWCENRVVLSGDKTYLQNLHNSILTEKKFFGHIDPTPQELLDVTSPNRENPDEMMEKYGYSDWYSFQSIRWGTKWEADIWEDSVVFVDFEEDNDSAVLSLSFMTAWAPPIGIYYVLQEAGISVEAKYLEEGMRFYGFYDNGDHTQGDYSTLDEVPDEIRETFQMVDWEEQED